jgi:hypothetical protein
MPPRDVDLIWAPFGANIVSKKWLRYFEDVLEANSVFVGEVRCAGSVSLDFVVLHGLNQPALMADKVIVKECNACGAVATWPTEGENYLVASAVEGRDIAVVANGVLFSSMLIRKNNLPPPRGAYRAAPVNTRAAARKPNVR